MKMLTLSPAAMNKSIIIVWSLMTWVFLVIGLHFFKNIWWTFFLYHGCCALPAIIWKRNHWSKHLKRPTFRQAVTVILAAALFGIYTYFTYRYLGPYMFNKTRAMASLTYRGFTMAMLIPLSVYFLTVNPIIEELFWRGVVLNELCEKDTKMFSLPVLWTNFFFAAWHVLVIRLFVAPEFMYIAVCTVMSVGIFLSWLYRRTDSLILPALWHSIVFDMAVIVILWSVVLT
jgi:membrane protease YdiL (CAAX protease family)